MASKIRLCFFVFVLAFVVSFTVSADSYETDVPVIDDEFQEMWNKMLRDIYFNFLEQFSYYQRFNSHPFGVDIDYYDRSVIPAKSTGIMTHEKELELNFGSPVPMTPGKAINGANPNYRKEQSVSDNYTKNCQRAVLAYELRRRGYDVEAVPRKLGNEYDENIYANVWYAFRNSAEYIKSPLPKSGKTAIEELLLEWGDGARAEISVYWQRGGGHVFIGENVDGEVIFLDPQTNKMNVEYYFNSVIPERTEIIRIDNASLTRQVYSNVRPILRTNISDSKWAQSYKEEEITIKNDEAILSKTILRK